MMALTLTFQRLRFPPTLTLPPTVSLFIKEYYSGTYVLIASNITIDANGFILDSPLPSTSFDPTLKYVLKSVNEMCGFEYEQNLIINPYCPLGFEISEDLTYCFFESITDPIPPSGSAELAIAVNHAAYTVCGSYIYNAGYNVNGTGTSIQIDDTNSFWINGVGSVNCGSGLGNTSDGPLNRTGLWISTTVNDQIIGFSICLDIPVSKTYYIGIAADNKGIVRIDGTEIINQDPVAISAQYGILNDEGTFRIWHIYPVNILSGSHVIELIGANGFEPFPLPNPASFGAEIYDNTSSEIAGATSYGNLNLIFSTQDYFGQPIQIGSDGFGYLCPDGYSLVSCASPLVCKRIITTPILY